ncbi:DUF4139 domain-containing protein [Ruegeria arenilitoris]|uniref:DUF4139 domain-containing protein n=1 Tax=Ruegeria arenilitoris TaxID=1173585 RepID=UPI0014818302|nr:DUF4139 domain-containing protein [Ruegeria arenilitoris]
MKALISFLAFAPALAFAETFTIETKVTEATIYPAGAEIIRSGTFNVPAGNHRLILPGIPAGDPGTQFTTLQVMADGLSQSSLIRRVDDVSRYDHENEAFRQAEDKVKAVEEQIAAVEDEARSARLIAEAAQQTIGFLGSLGHNEGLAGSGPDELRDLARMIGDETLRAQQTAHSSELEARKIEAKLDQLHKELEIAKDKRDALIPDIEGHLFVAVDVSAEVATSGNLTVSYLDAYAAEWMPSYEFHLKTGADPQVQISRSVLVSQHTGESWHDITMNVSTLAPTSQNSVSRLYPRLRTISEIADTYNSLEEPAVEAPVVVEETMGAYTLQTASVEGTGVTYTVPTPISVSAGSDNTEVSIDQFSQPAEVFAMAVPLKDDVAFRTVRFTNPLNQNLLPSELAKWFVDDILVAVGDSTKIGPREEVEMGFGPIFGLSVSSIVLDRSSGDAGIISRSNQRVETAEIRIANRTDQTWPIRIIDRMPYSEQDDLQIVWTAEPHPNEENVGDERGILAWETRMEPGQTEIIKLDLELSWPEDMALD